MTDETILHAENNVDDYEAGLDADGRTIIDEFGLWNQALLHGHNTTSTKVPNAVRHSMIHGLQGKYAAAQSLCGFEPCPGMRRRPPKVALAPGVPPPPVPAKIMIGEARRCYGAACPSCWTVAQIKCFRRIRAEFGHMQFGREQVYLRTTNLLGYEQPPHPALWRAFMAADTRYQLIAWTVGFGQDDTHATPAFDCEHSERTGELVYPAAIKFVGLWVAKPVRGEHVPIRESGVLYENRNTKDQLRISHGGVYDRASGRAVGAIDRMNVFGFDHAREEWLKAVGHPADIMEHSSYGPCVQRLSTWLTRSHGVRRTVHTPGAGPKSRSQSQSEPVIQGFK